MDEYKYYTTFYSLPFWSSLSSFFDSNKSTHTSVVEATAARQLELLSNNVRS
jgi:hypothetical protein